MSTESWKNLNDQIGTNSTMANLYSMLNTVSSGLPNSFETNFSPYTWQGHQNILQRMKMQDYKEEQ